MTDKEKREIKEKIDQVIDSLSQDIKDLEEVSD